jgi:hypothetical protein
MQLSDQIVEPVPKLKPDTEAVVIHAMFHGPASMNNRVDYLDYLVTMSDAMVQEYDEVLARTEDEIDDEALSFLAGLSASWVQHYKDLPTTARNEMLLARCDVFQELDESERGLELRDTALAFIACQLEYDFADVSGVQFCARAISDRDLRVDVLHACREIGLQLDNDPNYQLPWASQ